MLSRLSEALRKLIVLRAPMTLGHLVGSKSGETSWTRLSRAKKGGVGRSVSIITLYVDEAASILAVSVAALSMPPALSVGTIMAIFVWDAI